MKNLLRKIYYAFKKIVDPFYPQIFILTGMEKASQLFLTLAYAGEPSPTQEYWAQSVFGEGNFKKTACGRHFFFSITSFLRQQYPDCAFLLIDCVPLTLAHFSKKPGFNIPRWMKMDLDISIPTEQLLGSRRPGIRRRIKKHGLTYEMSRKSEDLDDFCHRMYQPYIQTRYKNMALVSNHSRLLEIFNKGELLLIKKDGLVIAGALIEFENPIAHFRMLGLRDGDEQYAEMGATGALYYFLTMEMKNRGYQTLSLGTTRPILTDGLTVFKKSIKAKISPHDTNDRIWLKPLKNTPAAQHFLLNNPFVFYTQDGNPNRAIFAEPKAEQEIKDILDLFECRGVVNTHLYIFFADFNYPGLAGDSSLSIKPADCLFS